MSPRTQEANDALHEERRKAILNAALNSFVEEGFEGTRMQEIADRCGMSYGLVYHYFASKEEVFKTLVEQALDAARALIQAFPQDSPPQAFVAFAISDPSPKYFALIVEALTKRSVPPGSAAAAREAIQGFKSVLAAAGSRAIPGDAEARAEGFLAILLGASIMKICGVSDGSFTSRAAMILTAGCKE